jgi:hypothetical protein
MVCCRYIIVNTLHKGENRDDGDDGDDDDDDDDCKIAAVKLKKKSVRLFQTLLHIPPVHPREPAK